MKIHRLALAAGGLVFMAVAYNVPEPVKTIACFTAALLFTAFSFMAYHNKEHLTL